MIHEELLLVINKYNSDIELGLRWEPDCFIKALRAVVELHKPEADGCGDVDCCGPQMFICSVCSTYNYPCPTIQAIKQELT